MECSGQLVFSLHRAQSTSKCKVCFVVFSRRTAPERQLTVWCRMLKRFPSCENGFVSWTGSRQERRTRGVRPSTGVTGDGDGDTECLPSAEYVTLLQLLLSKVVLIHCRRAQMRAWSLKTRLWLDVPMKTEQGCVLPFAGLFLQQHHRFNHVIEHYHSHTKHG